MMKAIGKVSASEKYPTSVDEFTFWLENDIIIRPFDIVKVVHYQNTITFAVIEDIIHITDGSGHLSSFVSSDFGDVESKPQTLRLGLTFAICKVISNKSKESDEQIYMPVLDGSQVFLCDENDIVEALGIDKISNPIPGGYIEMSDGTTVPINFNSDFLLGTEGAHLNISGISGLATKTSYAMFLLQAIQQKRNDVGFIILNVKGDDLLRINEPNSKLSLKQKEYYENCMLEPRPFQNVKFYYPFVKKSDKNFSNTYLNKEVIEKQHSGNNAFNYIYTYESTCEGENNQLELLFSNIDDPNMTIESILTEVSESSEFRGLNWDSFLNTIDEYTKKGHTKNKDITISSWRRFKRLIKKSISTNDFFIESMGSHEKRQVYLSEEVLKIKKNEVYIIDISKLDEQLQCFVFGDIVRAVDTLKLGQTDRKEADIPSRIVIFVDELNKYAPSIAPKTSPILNSLLEITERGRYNGVILFSAEQFKSAIHDRVKGNCSTHAYGRTNAIEVSKPDYRYVPKVFSNMMTRLNKGDLIIEHPIFTTLLKVKFPFPSYYQKV